MEVFKTRAFVGDEADDLLIDTIWHNEQWWLVSSWLADAAGHRLPEKIILMDGLRVRFQEVNQPQCRFLLSNALPTAVLDGEGQDGFVVSIHPAALLASQGPKTIQ